MASIATAICLLVGLTSVNSFQPSSFSPRSIKSQGSQPRPFFRTGPKLERLYNDFKGDFDDFPPEESSSRYEGDVDWDAEWKKVVQNKDKTQERPGKDFYKSDVELAAIRARKAAQEQMMKVQEQARKANIKAPDIRSLQGDWKFWIAILAILSIGTSLLAASGQTQSYTNESFYI